VVALVLLSAVFNALFTAVPVASVPVATLAARLAAGQQLLQQQSEPTSAPPSAAEDELDAALALEDSLHPEGSADAVHTPVEHDVGMYVQWANYVRRTASLLQQEVVVKAKTHLNEGAAMGASVSAAAGARGDPDADDRVEGRPILNQPDIIIHDHLEYQPTTVGQAKPWDWHAGVEGFRPTAGYFMQDPGCDRLMRIWFDTCAFIDASDSVFHHTPDRPFPTGAVDDGVNTAKYIGNLLKQDFESEPRSHSAKQNVGHFPNGEVHEVPDDGAPDEDAEKAWVYEG